MLTLIVAWLNEAANFLAGIILQPVSWLPGWLSATGIAVVTGILMLLVFKHTSNQSAIRQTRNQIKAALLSLSLFKDSPLVGLRAQGRIVRGAGRLMVLSIVPMLVMLIPMCLLLGQLALWYQARPLVPGEATVVTVHLAEGAEDALRKVELAGTSAVGCITGPVRVPAKNMVCWSVRADEPGLHSLSFSIGQRAFEKELAVGERFMPTSQKRPASSWPEMLLHPRERPFASGSPVESIEVDYPERDSWTSGTDSWIVFWFVVSLVAALAIRPFLKVSI